MKSRFEEYGDQISANTHALKLRHSPAHRWASNEDSLFQILTNWEALERSFAAVNIEYPLAGNKNVITEFFSVMKPVRHIQKLPQSKAKGSNVLIIY